MEAIEAKRTLYLGNLPPTLTRDEVHSLCIPFGEITSIDVALNPRTGVNKGFCFVEFEELDDCKAAVDNLNLAEVGGLTIRADFARPGQRQNTVHRAVQSNRPIWETEAYLQARMDEQTAKDGEPVAMAGTAKP